MRKLLFIVMNCDGMCAVKSENAVLNVCVHVCVMYGINSGWWHCFVWPWKCHCDKYVCKIMLVNVRQFG